MICFKIRRIWKIVFQAQERKGKDNSVKKTKNQRKIRNEFRKPIAFKFNKFDPTVKGCFASAKLELKRANPLVPNVSFFKLRKNSELLSGWLNFSDPYNCSQAYDLEKDHPINGLRVGKMGECQQADFKESLSAAKYTNICKKPLPLARDFSQNIDDEHVEVF